MLGDLKKIGIITTSNAINYGAVLQAFALKTVLNTLNKGNVEIINYDGNQSITGRVYYKKGRGIKTVINNLILFLNFKYKRKRKELTRYFDEFKSIYLGINTCLLTKKEDVINNICYNTLVCGSDQIWNLNLFHDDVYFLKFEDKFPNIKYCSYAASVTENMTEEQKKYILDNTKHFSLLSVREKNTAVSLEGLTKRKVENVLDPVFLIDAEMWSGVCTSASNKIEKDYALVFLISHSPKDQIIIDQICQNTDLKIVVINLHPLKYVKGNIYLDTVAPMQFVSLIKNATIVITDSFHATSFSILFNKEFYTIPRGKRNSRTENIFSLFKIENRYVTSNDVIERKPIAYNIVNKKIQEQRSISMEYLRKIVENKSD